MIDLVAGARPNFMKIAPLYRELGARQVDVRLVHTGQHYDERMNEIFFRQLALPQPDVNLGVGSSTHAEQTAKVMMAYDRLLREVRPELVVVVGDVNSTAACTLVATKLQIPVAHVEAGLRSGDRRMPEELNRIVTDALCDHLFVTEAAGVVNLRREGVPEGRIHLVGNVMIDTLIQLRDRARDTRTVEWLGLEGRPFILATFHRPSNVDELSAATRVVSLLERAADELAVVFPVHPRTRARLETFDLWSRLERRESIELLEPQGYLEFLDLMAHATVTVTDSGGIQEETTFLGTPCLTVRETTERPVTVTDGTNELVSLDPVLVVEKIREIRGGGRAPISAPPLWDGRAAGRIVDVLLERYPELT